MLYRVPSHVSVVTPERSEIMSSYNTPDTAARESATKVGHEISGVRA